jgi:hypothetical protein
MLQFYKVQTMMPTNFTMDYVSDPRYEILAIEVSFSGQRLFQANKDRGEIELEFDLNPRKLAAHTDMRFSLEDLLTVISHVRGEMDKINREE